jgi:hypothetical protein
LPQAPLPVWAYWMIMEASPKAGTTHTRCGALEKMPHNTMGHVSRKCSADATRQLRRDSREP